MRKSRSKFPVRRLEDGRALLNIACGSRIAPGWNNLDFSWLFRIGRYRRLSAVLHRLGLLHMDRYDRILESDPNTVIWDVRRGIPFPDCTFDALYHSHFLEHLERGAARRFLGECHRVLKTDGLLRVVVPDLEVLARRYLDVVSGLPKTYNMIEHAAAVEALFDQMVCRTPTFRRQQKPVVRVLEMMLIGDTASAGILHHWLYDQFSLNHFMREAGFEEIEKLDARRSRVAGWPSFNLDTNPNGTSYKPGSLYMEGRRT